MEAALALGFTVAQLVESTSCISCQEFRGSLIRARNLLAGVSCTRLHVQSAEISQR
jgi:hypothetical protein